MVKRLPANLQRHISLVFNVIILVSLIYLLPVSWKLFSFMKNVSAPTLNISWGFLFFSAPLSITLMIIHTFLRLFNAYE